jgi:hypothetical protein
VIERPYTDEDLRHEAARQHFIATTDPDFMGIGEQMQGTPIPSTVVDLEPEIHEPIEMARAWSHLAPDDFEAAQDSVDRLLGDAVDVSRWAIDLGADGLMPDEQHIDILGGGRTVVRILFASDPDMPNELRQKLIQAINDAVADEEVS